MIRVPDKAFLLAAGLGTRLRPHTDTMPKPMVPVAGRPILARALDKLAAVGVQDAWINLHYLPDIIKNGLYAPDSLKIHYSFEETLLDTGGGVKKCLPQMGNEPFYMINGDSLWTNGPENALVRLANAFDPAAHDLMLLLQPLHTMILTGATGDYDIIGGKPRRNHEKGGQYAFNGIRLLHPQLFDYEQALPDKFSFLALMDEAEKRGRLGYLIHDGDWHHISTPADLAAVDAALGAAGKAV